MLVTGAAAGIGRCTADLLATAGARVLLADIDAAAGEAAAGALRTAGFEARFVTADVSVAAEVEAMVDAALRAWGRLDAAVNNAGIEHAPARLADCAEDTWDRVLAIDLKSVFLCLRAELRAMERGGGAIVNVASVAGLGGAPTLGPYAAAKHGVVGLTRTAAVEYGRRRIRVNAVCPSYTRTRMVERILSDQPEMEQVFAKASPMRRLGEPGEVARAIAWLLSDEAAFVNGQALAIDGGLTAW